MIAERYTDEGTRIRREVSIGDRAFASSMDDVSCLENGASPWSRWWRSYLRGARPRFDGAPTGTVSIVDLFCGCGGLALGALEAVRAVGLQPRVLLGVDSDPKALAVYEANVRPEATLPVDIGRLVDFQIVGWGGQARFASAPRTIDDAVQAIVGNVDLVVAGPPCQGHSNLNNRTRRDDPRNLLYLDGVAMGIALGARAIVIENVPTIIHDRFRILQTAISLLQNAGYITTGSVLACHELGWPQRRRRFFLVASRCGAVRLTEIAGSLAREPSPLRWAIEDLVDATADSVMDSVPCLSPENRARIDYLFDKDLYDLPNHMRPSCHRNGHTYPSVYGRLHWDRPAGTITTGFMSPGRGRFVHPSRRRTLTPHEAARLQGFPDIFQFSVDGEASPSKKTLAKWIGDAVPPILGYSAVLAVLEGFLERT